MDSNNDCEIAKSEEHLLVGSFRQGHERDADMQAEVIPVSHMACCTNQHIPLCVAYDFQGEERT